MVVETAAMERLVPCVSQSDFPANVTRSHNSRGSWAGTTRLVGYVQRRRNSGAKEETDTVCVHVNGSTII